MTWSTPLAGLSAQQPTDGRGGSQSWAVPTWLLWTDFLMRFHLYLGQSCISWKCGTPGYYNLFSFPLSLNKEPGHKVMGSRKCPCIWPTW
jgi:hypothetical protein